MKRDILGASVALLLFSGAALAQTVVIEPQQRTRIKEYVERQSVPRVTVRERIHVGSSVPRDVELREVPEDWGPSMRRYRYFHSEHGVHLVDPESRSVVYDVD
jgi:hypothetical protein